MSGPKLNNIVINIVIIRVVHWESISSYKKKVGTIFFYLIERKILIQKNEKKISFRGGAKTTSQKTDKSDRFYTKRIGNSK